MTGNIVHMNQFVEVVSDKKLRKDSIYKGDLFMVTAFKEVRESKKDFYLYRKYVICTRFVNGKLLLPEKDNEHRVYMIDPRNLQYVGEERQKEYEQKLREQFE